MRTTRQRLAALMALGALGVVACTDSPNAPAQDETLTTAALIEQAATEAVGTGDATGGAQLAFVASALRNGVRPTPYEAFTGERWEKYDALVMVEEHTGPEPMSHQRFDRNFFMWQRVGETGMHLMRVKTTGEHGHMDVGSGDPGVGNYAEQLRGTKQMEAYRGFALIVEKGVAGPCMRETPLPATMHRVTCNIAEYAVNFELMYKRLGAETPKAPWLMWARPQVVNGVKWVVYELE